MTLNRFKIRTNADEDKKKYLSLNKIYARTRKRTILNRLDEKMNEVSDSIQRSSNARELRNDSFQKVPTISTDDKD